MRVGNTNNTQTYMNTQLDSTNAETDAGVSEKNAELKPATWGPFKALGSTIRRYAQFRGRASRKEFWYTALGHTLFNTLLTLLIIVGAVISILGDYNLTTCVVLTSIAGVVYMLYQMFIFLPMLALLVRRMHDTGRSGAALCFYFIPLAGPIILLVFLLTPSAQANQYGAAPEDIADKTKGGKFLNGIIWPIARAHRTWKSALLTYSCGIFLYWFILYLATPAYIDFGKYDSSTADAYRKYRRGEQSINHYPFAASVLQFSDATEEEICDYIEALIDQDADLNEPNRHKKQALAFAIEKNYPTCAKLLLDNGADVDGDPYLYIATTLNNTELMSLLLDYGAAVNRGTNQTPLSYAAKHGYTDALNLLLKHKANLGYGAPLHQSIKNGHIECTKQLINAGADLNSTEGDYGKTPLLTAINNKQTESIKFLLEAGADPNKWNYESGSPLYQVIKQGSVEHVQLLINAGADVNATWGGNTEPALLTAVLNNQTECVRVLIDNKADINYKKNDHSNIFEYAVKNGNLDIVKLLISAGVEMDYGSTSALAYAYDHGLTEIANLMATSGADTNITYNNGETLFCKVIRKKDSAFAKKMIAAGVNVNKGSVHPLLLAYDNNLLDLVEALIDAGANVNVTGRDGLPLLVHAIKNNQSKLAEKLIAAGAELNKAYGTYSFSTTPLNYAIINGNVDLIKHIIASKASINSYSFDCAISNKRADLLQLLVDNVDNVNNYADTLDVSNAIQAKMPEGVLILAKAGIKADWVNVYKKLIQDGYYQTAIELADTGKEADGSILLLAAEKGSAELVSKLLEKGITPDYQDTQGKTALSMALANKHTPCVKLLLERGVKENTNRHLIQAAQAGYVDAVKLLIDAGADVNYVDNNGATPFDAASSAPEDVREQCVQLLIQGGADTKNYLCIAAANGNLNSIKLLVNGGCDINMTDKAGNTPLMHAAKNGHAACVEYLCSLPGIKINAANTQKATALRWAAENNHTDCVIKLCAIQGIDPNAADTTGNTPLLVAVYNNSPKCVEALCSVPGIKLEQTNKEGFFAMLIAAHNGFTECVRILGKHPQIKINQKFTKTGFTPLHHAVMNGHVDCVKYILAVPGIDVNCTATSSETALHTAAGNGQSECVRLLCNAKGIKVNQATKKEGYTALFIAATKGDAACVEALLESPSVDVNQGTKTSETPLIIAAYNGHAQCVSLLLDSPKIKPHKEHKSGGTAFFYAAAEGRDECVYVFLQKCKFTEKQLLEAKEVANSQLHGQCFNAINSKLREMKSGRR